MSFKPVNFARLVKFNSAASSDFLDFYGSLIDKEIVEHDSEPKHRTFAPSAFRCPRVSWFRLRGVQPDIQKKPDRVMEFAAEVGTACHETIQRRLKANLGDDWMSVKQYLAEHPIQSKYELEEEELETKISIQDPPVRFACDGIIRWNGKIYFLEIKTSEFASFDELTSPKSQHIEQIRCYSALLGIEDVLVLYQDRQYGELKCYEVHVSHDERQAVLDKMKYVQDMVEANLAPEKLPKGDPWCSSSHCIYYNKCKEW